MLKLFKYYSEPEMKCIVLLILQVKHVIKLHTFYTKRYVIDIYRFDISIMSQYCENSSAVKLK